MAEKRRLGTERWFRENWFEHAIIDAGVETFFFVRKLKDYPEYFLKMYKWRALLATRKFGKDKVWITIPDYPDDYEQELTWENGKDNVDKTFENIKRFGNVDEVNWLFPIQANYLSQKSFRESCKKLKDDYNPKRVGIGTVCKTRNLKFIANCVRESRQIFGEDVWIHAFGPTLNTLPKIWFYLDSFDSSSQFFLGNRMVRNADERIKAFKLWQDRLTQIVEKPLITDFIE